MAYVDYETYKELYGEIEEAAFNRLQWDASRILNSETSGVDGYRKLKYAFPTDEEDVGTIRHCACVIINTMHRVENAVSAAETSFVEREDGTVVGKVVSSISSGSESISYSTNTGTSTVVDKVVSGALDAEELYRNTVRKYLSGVQDANGVNLLYGGVYPVL